MIACRRRAIDWTGIQLLVLIDFVCVCAIFFLSTCIDRVDELAHRMAMIGIYSSVNKYESFKWVLLGPRGRRKTCLVYRKINKQIHSTFLLVAVGPLVNLIDWQIRHRCEPKKKRICIFRKVFCVCMLIAFLRKYTHHANCMNHAKAEQHF